MVVSAAIRIAICAFGEQDPYLGGVVRVGDGAKTLDTNTL